MIVEKFKDTISRYGLISKGDKLVVGVSGGPDSVALLYLLNAVKDDMSLRLYIAHLDHMLRPGSRKDADFVKSLGARLKMPVTAGKANVRRLVKKGSLEEAGRNARLAFFFKVAKNIGAKKICLGHNLDDQAETVLMRLIRGAGLYGLAGILPKRNICGFTVIRPLLGIRRREIEGYLKKNKAGFRIDETNKEDIYLRNKLRNRLLPLLEKEYNANIKEVLSNTALSSGSDYDYLASAAAKLLKRLGAGKVSLPAFLKLHPAMQNLILRQAIARLSGDMRRLTFKHVEEINDLALNRPSGSVVDLPKGISVIKRKKYLLFCRRR